MHTETERLVIDGSERNLIRRTVSGPRERCEYCGTVVELFQWDDIVALMPWDPPPYRRPYWMEVVACEVRNSWGTTTAQLVEYTHTRERCIAARFAERQGRQ